MGINYELSDHASRVLNERQIKIEWLESVLHAPERREPDQGNSNLTHLLSRIAEHGNRVLRVVANENVSPIRIVTVYFDRKMKGKL